MTKRPGRRALSRVFARAWLPWLLVLFAIPAVLVPVALIAPTSLFGAVAFAMAMLAVAAPLFFSPTTVHVGRDGISITWFGRARFLAYREIASVRSYESPFGASTSLCGALVSLHSGEQISIPISGTLDDGTMALANEITDALIAYDATDDHEDVSSVLSRGARPVHEWIATLRALGGGSNVGFREAPVDERVLWRVVESPAAKREDRAAAAIALRAAQREDAPQRLRIAAASIAEPQLRVFVETVAVGDDEAIESALRGVAK